MCIREGTKEECGDDAAEYQVRLFGAMLGPTLEAAGCNIGKFDSGFYIQFRTNRFYLSFTCPLTFSRSLCFCQI